MKSIGNSLQTWLDRFDPDGQRTRFMHICNNWEKIMGEDTARLVKPLGTRNKTLILGAEDSIVIQEITFASSQILDMLNDFCQGNFFDNIRVELLKGRTPLDQRLVPKSVATTLEPRKPAVLGNLKEIMNHDSPVAKCYATYLNYFKNNKI